MAIVTKKIKLAGKEIVVSEVPAVDSKEFFNEYKLEDGAEIRVKSVATSIMRIEGEYAPDGKPLYMVLCGQVVSVGSVPEDLLKKG